MAGQDQNGNETEVLENPFLTKTRLLQGAALVEEVETELGVFRIRPLTDGERARADALAVRGITTKGRPSEIQDAEVQMDLEMVTSNEWEVKFFILAAGLSISKDPKERFSVGEVKLMRLGEAIITKLLNRIRYISGMPDAEELVRRFRGKQPGSGLNPPDSSGGNAPG